jgi:hypothetical protein
MTQRGPWHTVTRAHGTARRSRGKQFGSVFRFESLPSRLLSCLRTSCTPVARHCALAIARLEAGSSGLGRKSEPLRSSPSSVMMRTSGLASAPVDLPVLVGGADRDVTQGAEVAERDLAERVDFVATDAVVGRRRLESGLGLEEALFRRCPGRSCFGFKPSLSRQGLGWQIFGLRSCRCTCCGALDNG